MFFAGAARQAMRLRGDHIMKRVPNPTALVLATN
jgi:hypothetical protein